MIGLENIKSQILEGNSIESILSKFNWQNFESVVAEIFAENGFFVCKNLRFKTKRRYEIDVVASKMVSGHGIVFSSDCKEWGRGRYKNSILQKAADSHIARTKEFETFVSNDPIARHKLKIGEDCTIYPTMVTLFEEHNTDFDCIFMIPVWKLNSFLNSF